METQLVFRYAGKAADGSKVITTSPIRLGYGRESNQLGTAEFEELDIEGSIEAWFEQLNLMSLWLMNSSDGLRGSTTQGSYSIYPGPGKALVVKATLQQYEDFQGLALGLIAHLTQVDGRYL